jgi:hypothetical protein
MTQQPRRDNILVAGQCACRAIVPDNGYCDGCGRQIIRAATDDELAWIDSEIDPDLLRQMEAEEIERTVASTPTPPHWRFPER